MYLFIYAVRDLLATKAVSQGLPPLCIDLSIWGLVLWPSGKCHWLEAMFDLFSTHSPPVLTVYLLDTIFLSDEM